MASPPRIAVIGHVEHITLGRVDRLPDTGEIVHLEDAVVFPGGGGGVAFWQLVHGPGAVELFTALGDDDAGRVVAARLGPTGATVHAARRAGAHTRDLVMVTPDGERTIVVVGWPLHPERADDLPWDRLAACDAAYFTAQDPGALVAARAARRLVVSSRRQVALRRAGVEADVVVGSAVDRVEACALVDFPVPPRALVMTEGPEGGYVETDAGTERFEAPRLRGPVQAAYGAGDSFAGALTFYLACGLPVIEACRRATEHGAAVLAGAGDDPLARQKPLPWPVTASR